VIVGTAVALGTGEATAGVAAAGWQAAAIKASRRNIVIWRVFIFCILHQSQQGIDATKIDMPSMPQSTARKKARKKGLDTRSNLRDDVSRQLIFQAHGKRGHLPGKSGLSAQNAIFTRLTARIFLHGQVPLFILIGLPVNPSC
jgi:hypothetical protein